MNHIERNEHIVRAPGTKTPSTALAVTGRHSVGVEKVARNNNDLKIPKNVN